MRTTKSIKMILLILVSLGSTEISRAQCSGSTTIFSENFGTGGDGTNCFSTVPASGMSSSLTFIPGPTNGGNPPSDGQYSVWCNRVYGWFNWHDPFSDATVDAVGVNGNMAIINGINSEFYRKTITVCPAKTYTVYFSLANLVDADIGSCGSPFDPNITASAYDVGTTTGTTTSIGTIGMTSTITWNTYSFTFTTGAAQTSIDVVLNNLNGGGCGNDFAFDDFSVVGPSTVLPVTLLSFSAERQTDELIKLEWKTADEIANNYFIIERSTDAVNFIALGKLDGKETPSGFNYYTFTDTTNFKTACYRLKQVDNNGTYGYSKIVCVENEKQNIQVYPNPAYGAFQIELDNATQYDEIMILTIDGKPIKTISSELIQDTLEITGLSKGMYLIRFTSKTSVILRKVVIH